MTKYTYADLLPARKVLARMIFESYPDAETLDEIPQELVQAFDILTDIVRSNSHGTTRVTYFEKWWNRRDNLTVKWWVYG